MKKALIIFGVLDLITILKSYRFWTGQLWNFELSWISVVLILFYISLLISVFFLLKRKPKGLLFYYFQFPIRISLSIFSFGFIMPLSKLFENHGLGVQVFSIICLVLEASRLAFTIIVHKKLKNDYN